MFGIVCRYGRARRCGRLSQRGNACQTGKNKDAGRFPALTGNPASSVLWETNNCTAGCSPSSFPAGDAGERVREALKAGERQKAHAELHTLKGVAGNLSLVPLADYVLAAEQAVKHDDVSHEGELIDAMDRELEALIRALKASGL